MRSWFHLSRGTVLRQAHVNLPELGGLKEDMITRRGFSGQAVNFYRRNAPTAWNRIEGPMQARDIDGLALDPTDRTHADGGPLRLFHNPDVTISVSRRTANMTYSARNADGDELHFVHEGTGTVYTEYGPIPYEPGDFVLLPKGVTYRLRPDGPTNYFLIIESPDEIGFADIGPVGRYGPFDPSLLFIPSPSLDDLGDGHNEDGEYAVRIKSGGEYTSVFYDFDPIDAEGWKGDLFPVKLNIRDYRPITSERLHVMPAAHGIFATPNVLVANMLPRPAEADPEVERVPPFHRNIDCDEFIFAHGGEVLGMPLIPATINHYPQGLHHGLPEAVSELARKNWKRDEYYNQKLIAVDTRRPLTPTPQAVAATRHVDQIREGLPAD
ncbi:homogentisate 1,2-dioxygenase [Mycobacterium sp. NPDC003449]